MTGGASILSGFSKDVLAAAQTNKPTLGKMRTSQTNAVIVKLEQKDGARGPAERAPGKWPSATLGDSSFNLEESPDLITRGGSYNSAQAFKMPILDLVGMSAACVKLKPVRHLRIAFPLFRPISSAKDIQIESEVVTCSVLLPESYKQTGTSATLAVTDFQLLACAATHTILFDETKASIGSKSSEVASRF